MKSQFTEYIDEIENQNYINAQKYSYQIKNIEKNKQNQPQFGIFLQKPNNNFPDINYQ